MLSRLLFMVKNYNVFDLKVSVLLKHASSIHFPIMAHFCEQYRSAANNILGIFELNGVVSIRHSNEHNAICEDSEKYRNFESMYM